MRSKHILAAVGAVALIVILAAAPFAVQSGSRVKLELPAKSSPHRDGQRMVVSPARAAPKPPPGAPPGGFTPANAQPSQETLTPQEQLQLDQKEAAVAACIQSDCAHNPKTPTTDSGISPDCVIGPAGQCVYWITVSLGGQYTIEPPDQPNWCGPGAATAVAMHWDPNGVANNHSGFWAQKDPNAPWYGASTQYWNEQGWMAWYAQGLGVQPYPNTDTNTGSVKWGLNTALNTGFYWSTNVGADEASLFAKVTTDIGTDGHPMIYLVNAHWLPEWNGWGAPGSLISHFIEGYGYGYWDYDPNNTASEKVYYADTASSADGYGNVAGDNSMTFDDFYNRPWVNGYMYLVW